MRSPSKPLSTSECLFMFFRSGKNGFVYPRCIRFTIIVYYLRLIGSLKNRNAPLHKNVGAAAALFLKYMQHVLKIFIKI